MYCIDRRGENSVQKIIGYHGTKASKKDLIIKNGFKIPERKKEDNYWLGHGIYFFSDYELAEWWAITKVNRHRIKYGSKDFPCVIRAEIRAENVLDLDNPFALNQFFFWCHESASKEIIPSGVVLDFDMGDGQEKAKQRERCFWLDYIKEEKDISVIIYTFSKKNPSYGNHHHMKDVGLYYNEKQICVSDNKFIVHKEVIGNGENFDEEIV